MSISTMTGQKFPMATTTTTDELIYEWRPQVFINFRGADLRLGFISHLTEALEKNKINYYIDNEEPKGAPLEILFQRIKESQIALVFFSNLYAESEWCLDELVEIMKNMEKGNLRVIPIFFKVKPEDVKGQKKEFGVALYGEGRRKRPKMTQWEDALEAVPTRMGLVLTDQSPENDFLLKLVNSVKEVEAIILKENRGRSSSSEPNRNLMGTSSSSSPPPYEEQRLEHLEERFGFDDKVTQIFGIVGIAGIGKTTLAQKHFDKWGKRLAVKKIIHKNNTWLMEELEAEIFQDKCFIVLDDVSGKSQIQYLLSKLHQIKKGSKIVITTRDKSWIEGIVHDTYVVPGLNDNEALLLFSYHAFKDQAYTPTQKGLSKKFVDYAEGNPRALEELGKELCGKDDAQWEERIETLSHRCNVDIKRELKISYDKLTDQQKDAFLDIACFFPSEKEDCVTSLLASEDSGAEAARRVVGDLADKFMISVSAAGQIEMPQMLCSLGKELGLLPSVDDNMGKSRLWDHDTVVEALVNKKGEDSTVRGISLDVSKLKEEIAIASNKLTLMPNLRYLKIFDSSCPRQCKVVVEAVECKVHLPDELYLPLEKIRYLHWLKFPLTELPSDFIPKNLVDLRLPYSMIERVWGGKKDTPNLKWVDLSHSTKLTDLSALCNAGSLEILNLEGCTELVDFPEDTENMKSLSFLNLRGCTSLSSLPEMKTLVSLKTLILSGCSSFDDFNVKSENLEHLHLDGTEIMGLPRTIQELQRLIVLNLKDCKQLRTLPGCIGKLKALEELILSGCSRLKRFPEIKENMENLQILLLDRTQITDVPEILLQRCANPVDQANNVQSPPRTVGLSLLRHLCLSRNDKIVNLKWSVSELYHLKWIDLKYCKKLECISTLPPNLQCLDAHGCTSLKTVASPPMATEQVPSSFIFTNCDNLQHVAKNEITCYGHDKSQILSKILNSHNKGLSLEALVSICFPGSEVPAWFGHKASGSMLKPELPQHWSDSGLVGIALCAIVAFEGHNIGNHSLHVKCIFDFNNVKTSFSYFPFGGGLWETSDEQRTITSTHVFIGYTNWLNIKKCQEEDGKESFAPKTKKDGKEGCVTTKASIEFQVTNDSGVVKNCEVLKCGFSLVYETGSWEASSRTDGVDDTPLQVYYSRKKQGKRVFGSNEVAEEHVGSSLSAGGFRRLSRWRSF